MDENLPEGIRVDSATAEISPAGLRSLIQGRGVAVRITRVDATVSTDAVNALLQASAAPAVKAADGQSPPEAPAIDLSRGRVHYSASREGRALSVEIWASGAMIDFLSGSIRVRIE